MTVIDWEFEKCDLFTMYFSFGESDQPICMYELGRNICRMQSKYPVDWRDHIVITADPNYKRFDDVRIQVGLATLHIVPVLTRLSDHISRIVNIVPLIAKGSNV